MSESGSRRLEGDLLVECAEWIWEQLQEDGHYMAGELIEEILKAERELGVQAQPLERIAGAVESYLAERGIGAQPQPIEAQVIRVVLEWEDEFLGFAGIPRELS